MPWLASAPAPFDYDSADLVDVALAGRFPFFMVEAPLDKLSEADRHAVLLGQGVSRPVLRGC